MRGTDIMIRLYCADNMEELDRLIDPLSEQEAKRQLKGFLASHIRDRRRRMAEEGYGALEDGAVASHPYDNLTPEQERKVEEAFDQFMKHAIADAIGAFRIEDCLTPAELEGLHPGAAHT